MFKLITPRYNCLFLTISLLLIFITACSRAPKVEYCPSKNDFTRSALANSSIKINLAQNYDSTKKMCGLVIPKYLDVLPIYYKDSVGQSIEIRANKQYLKDFEEVAEKVAANCEDAIDIRLPLGAEYIKVYQKKLVEHRCWSLLRSYNKSMKESFGYWGTLKYLAPNQPDPTIPEDISLLMGLTTSEKFFKKDEIKYFKEHAEFFITYADSSDLTTFMNIYECTKDYGIVADFENQGRLRFMYALGKLMHTRNFDEAQKFIAHIPKSNDAQFLIQCHQYIIQDTITAKYKFGFDPCLCKFVVN